MNRYSWWQAHALHLKNGPLHSGAGSAFSAHASVAGLLYGDFPDAALDPEIDPVAGPRVSAGGVGVTVVLEVAQHTHSPDAPVDPDPRLHAPENGDVDLPHPTVDAGCDPSHGRQVNGGVVLP